MSSSKSSHPERTATVRRWAIVITLTVVGVGLGAGVASAHVTVSPSEATQGSYTTLTFRVPNESDTAGTVGLVITIPAETPIASVRFRDQPGWTAKAVVSQLPAPVTQGDVELTEAVSTVTFTADRGTAIGPGAFAEFALSAGPLPDIASISFPTTQVYDDGTEVVWDEPTPADGSEPEHPAPTVQLVAGSESGHDHDGASTSAPAASAESTAGPAVTSAHESGHAADSPEAAAKSDTAARILAVLGLVVGALGLLVGALGFRRARNSGPRKSE